MSNFNQTYYMYRKENVVLVPHNLFLNLIFVVAKCQILKIRLLPNNKIQIIFSRNCTILL